MESVKKGLQVSVLGLLVTMGSAWAYAGAQEGGGDGCAGRADVLIGQDNDNVDNPLIQPIAPPPNQSLNNADILQGGGGCDVLMGLLGNDVLDGGNGSDIMIGGTEQFDPGGFGNKDVMLGGAGNDTNVWAPGDGSDAFIGGAGGRDAQVFGLIDRDYNNVPTLTHVNGTFSETGVPTANVTGSPGFCRLEYVGNTDLGFDFLVRFFVRATGNLAVTIRLKDVEQVFCTSEQGGQITFADLTGRYPHFVEVSQHEVQQLNRTVGRIVR
ncbi:MAG: hypothetical protein AB8G17_01730 [Gammaproteobacteria bacterium]